MKRLLFITICVLLIPIGCAAPSTVETPTPSVSTPEDTSTQTKEVKMVKIYTTGFHPDGLQAAPWFEIRR